MEIKNEKYLLEQLLHNGLDFIDESILNYDSGKQKYSIIHFTSAVEVLLKYHIAHKDWKDIILESKRKKITEANLELTVLLDGEYPTISISDCIKILGEELNNKGIHFRKLAKERNNAVHFFLDNTKSEVLHYDVFEDIRKLLSELPDTKKILLDKRLRSIAQLVKRSAGEKLDNLMWLLEEKQKLTKEKITQTELFLKGICLKFYEEDIPTLFDNQSIEVVNLKDVCSISFNQETENSYPLKLYSGNFYIDTLNNNKGVLMAYLTPNNTLLREMLEIIVIVNQRQFSKLSIGSILPRISIHDIGNIRIRYIPLSLQVKFIGLYNCVNSKINLLQRQSELLSDHQIALKNKLYI
ncbi:hypothetical protein G7051_01615 [Dysgonomonas sp. HDW5B]|uniref:hypothetical protein n=1 Tax=Dysgonomonas sp. HDW5B TaxID=2714927 RepID=UPI00140D6554|nr:hypothetical protein [Dysgonomonas sp. HDW5B]QIK53118.1 hypothetical protein G7051_01615 [Dysgonomonas sp. HDW5B]